MSEFDLAWSWEVATDYDGKYEYGQLRDRLHAACAEVEALRSKLADAVSREQYDQVVQQCDALGEMRRKKLEAAEARAEAAEKRAAKLRAAAEEVWGRYDPEYGARHEDLEALGQALSAADASIPGDSIASITCPRGHRYPAPADARKAPGPCPTCDSAKGEQGGSD